VSDRPTDEPPETGADDTAPGPSAIADLVSDAAAGLRAARGGKSDAAGKGGLRVVGGTAAGGDDDLPPLDAYDDDDGGGSGGRGSDGRGSDGDGPDKPNDDQARALLDTTDNGMALRLSHYLSNELIFCEAIGWLRFDGQRFDADEGKALAHRAVLDMRDQMKRVEYPALKDWFAPVLYVNVRGLDDDDKAEAQAARTRARGQLSSLWKAAIALGNVKKQESTLKQAAVLRDFRVRFATLDAGPNLFNTPGGVLSLPLGVPKVGEELLDSVASVTVRAADAEDRITRVALARPNLVRLMADEDDCPLWRKHLRAVFPEDRDKLQLFQRICGSMLVSHNPRQNWFIFQGEGGDGKSTTVAALKEVLGDYFRTGTIETILFNPRVNAGGTREDLMRLAGGTRVVLFPEPNHKQMLDGTMIKSITGGEELSARGGYGKQTEFDPQFKMVMMCNPRPKVEGDDEGFWRRPIFVRFPHRFLPHQIDTDIIPKLRAERDGILNWMIEGFADWRTRGFDYAPPRHVIDDLNSYRRQSSQFAAWAQDRIIWGRWWNEDALRDSSAAPIWAAMQAGTASVEDMAWARDRFLTDDVTVFDSPRWVPRADIYEDFAAWCDAQGFDPWRPNTFAREFAAKARAFGAQEAPRSGAKGRGWTHFTFVNGVPMRRDSHGGQYE